jgi:hypothetical protein
VRWTPRLAFSSALCFAAAAVLVSGCGDGKDPGTVDVTKACDRLEELAVAVKSAQLATTPQEVRTAVQGPLTAFVDAAAESGDGPLADFARTYESRLSDYLEADGIDAREAGNDADIALDRAGARCAELGASNDFPTNT